MTPSERLAFLSDKLVENAHDEKGMRFDLLYWTGTEMAGRPQRNCNTTGCAVGLAMLTPEFQAEGFKSAGGLPIFKPDPLSWAHSGWGAVEEYFGFSNHEEALWLFGMDAYPITKGAEAELLVADRIKAYLKGIRPDDDDICRYKANHDHIGP